MSAEPPGGQPGTPPPLPAVAPPPLPPAMSPQPVPPPPSEPPSSEPPPEPASSVCESCGAQLSYAPGTMVMRCEACGSEKEIEQTGTRIREHSLDAWQAKNLNTLVANLDQHELRCRSCGAMSATDELSSTCQFCGGALVAVEVPEGLVEPEAVIPFHLDGKRARQAFRAWISTRRFAPNALKNVGSTEGLTGTYLPHWTYDAHTETDYQGKRGDYYYTTHTRSVPDGKGGTRTETYQQRHTRWSSASGHVRRSFDDVVVLGSRALDPEKVDKMGPWKLEEAKPYQPEFVTGYSAVRYDVDPQAGSEKARGQMQAVITKDVKNDIGGDEQRVDHLDVSYSQATFKLMLMPLWIATYLYGGQTWQVLVNAKTGEVVGDRPYSKVKIVLAVLAAVVLVAAIVAGVIVSNR